MENLTTLGKIELIEKLLSEVKKELISYTSGPEPKAFEDTGGSNPPGPGTPGKP